MESYNENMRQRESSNDYSAVNSIGYAGAYQMGADALFDLGYMKKKPKKVSQKEWMADPKNWTGKDEVSSLQNFLDSPEKQEKIQGQWNKTLDKRTERMGLDKYYGQTIDGVKITPDGVRAASHLLGHGDVKKALASGDLSAYKDGFGTTAGDYFRMMPEKVPEIKGGALVPEEVAPVNKEKEMGGSFSGFANMLGSAGNSIGAAASSAGSAIADGAASAGTSMMNKGGALADMFTSDGVDLSQPGQEIMMSPVQTGLSPDVLAGRAKPGDAIQASPVETTSQQIDRQIIDSEIDAKEDKDAWKKAGQMAEAIGKTLEGGKKSGGGSAPSIISSGGASGGGKLGMGMSFKDFYK